MTGKTTQETLLKTLLVSELVGSTRWTEHLGDERASELLTRHDRLARDLLPEEEGEEIERRQGFVLLFERPVSAVRYALAYLQGLAKLSRDLNVELVARVGIHLGEVVLIENPQEDIERGARPLQIEGLAKLTAARVTSLARERQILLTRTAFDLARRATVGTQADDDTLTWLAHGRYLFKGMAQPIEVFEVGTKGIAPLGAPIETATAYNVSADETVLGWRPAVGLEVPQRPRWKLRNKLGEGGFGEVWLAAHEKTGDRRVLKFCFELERLRGLQREITLFRLLKETLGDRQDITRILDWNFEEAPYFIESEYTSGGDLVEWAEARGGIAQVALETRLEIVGQAAEALAAAHSVGVLHKDVKPANILIYDDAHGKPRARLTDFGIGLLIEPDRLVQTGITMLGLTEVPGEAELSPGTGTRLYMAPELLAGEAATVQADVYALGIILYQVVVGDFTRALAAGWERDVEDDVLRGDIAWAVDGSPQRRLGNAWRVSEWLRNLEKRRSEMAAEQRAQEEAKRMKAALRRSRSRRKLGTAIIAALTLFASAMAIQKKQADLEAERANLEAGRANLEAESAAQMLKLLVDLFAHSDPDQARGHEMTVREALDRGAHRISQELEGQALVQARLQDIVGTIYQKMGFYEESRMLLEAALSTRVALLGESSLAVAESQKNLADVYRNQGNFKQAEKLYQSALITRESVLGPDHLDVSECLNALGIIAWRQARNAEAEELYRRAIVIMRAKNGDHRILARSLNNLAILHWEQERNAEAKTLYLQSLELSIKTTGSDSTDTASMLNNLSTISRKLSEHAEAVQLSEKALVIMEKNLGPEHRNVASVLKNLGLAHAEAGSHLEAEGPLLRARTIWESIDPNHSQVASVLNGLGNLYRDSGRYSAAEASYTRALDILDRTLGPEHPRTMETLQDYALLLGITGRDSEAAELQTRSRAGREGIQHREES